MSRIKTGYSKPRITWRGDLGLWICASFPGALSPGSGWTPQAAYENWASYYLGARR